MKSSLQRRFVLPLGVSIALGLGVSGYILNKFRSYEDSATRVMSGDQRAVLVGHLIESRVKAAEELVQGSVSSQEANDVFKEKLLALADEVKNLSKVHSDKSLEEVRQIFTGLATSRNESVEDLFVHYRNLKTSAFNIYRLAWGNKWMTVAKTMGMIINDLDNLPYTSGEKAASSVYSKIAGLSAVITQAALPQGSKLLLFGQLGGLKTQITRYTDATQRSEKSRAFRLEELRRAGGVLKKYNDAQGKTMMQFSDTARSEVFKGIIAFLLLILASFAWYLLAARNFAKHLSQVTSTLTKQLAAWVSTGGNLTAQGFKAPDSPDFELNETYQALDQVMRRIHVLRKEDLLVKRLLNVPMLLVGPNKQAIFWNSALSNLAKSRALEETGPVVHAAVVKFLDAQNKSLDPIEKAFEEGKEVTQLVLLKANEDRIATFVVCTPVMGPDNKPEYVMVHLRDLREENRRFETELEKQLQIVLEAMKQIQNGKLPEPTTAVLRRPVAECMNLLKTHALTLQESSSVMAASVETMQVRMARESTLKKNVHGRMEQLKDEVAGVKTKLGELRAYADTIMGRMTQMDSRDRLLRTEYGEIRRRGRSLLSDLKYSQDLISVCLTRLEEAEEISLRVKSNDKMIESILEKSTLLNANNSILGSKRELTPGDVVTITENIGQLMGQFQRSYRFMTQSVGDIDRGLVDLASKLRENLNACIKLAADEHSILQSIVHSERLIEADASETRGLSKEISTLKNVSVKIANQLQGVEHKAQSLVQIGRASIDLQDQLENGFRGMFRRASAPEIDS